MNSKQKAARGAAKEKGIELPSQKPIAKVTVGVIIVLAICSVIYHSLKLPY